MSFLSPYFLLLLPLAGLPLLLFIGLKGKRKLVVFSTIYLLKREEFKDERVRQKLRMWLIIILRVLMLLSIILLLSRPRYFGNKWHNAYFDASISMKGKSSKKALVKLLNIFGKDRVSIINTQRGHLFKSDTSEVPEIGENDVFYTDGRVPYLPPCKLMCAKFHKKDAWIFADSIKGNRFFLNINLPEDAFLKVYNLKGIIDSQLISSNTKHYIYTAKNNEKYIWFYIDYKDHLMDNNYYFHVFSENSIGVRLIHSTPILSTFFSTYPFYMDSLSTNCVSIDTPDPYCENQVVFFKNKDMTSYISSSKKVPFGRWHGYMIHSGLKTLLLFNFYPYDTSSQFYDIAFLKSLSRTLKRMFGEDRLRKNMYIRDIDPEKCTGPIGKRPGIITGFYVCQDDTVSVNVNKAEYISSSLCDNKTIHKYSFSDLSSIMSIKRFLIYFLVLLFILETLLVYFL